MQAWRRTAIGAVVGAALWAGTGVAPAAAADGRVDVVVGGEEVLDAVTVDRASERAARLCGGKASAYVKKARKADRGGSLVVVCRLPGGKPVYFR